MLSMRTTVDRAAGSIAPTLPLLSAAAASTVGNVFPPSVDSKIFTWVTLIGAANVLATSQVMVLRPAINAVPLGCVTLNGPAPAVNWTGKV